VTQQTTAAQRINYYLTQAKLTVPPDHTLLYRGDSSKIDEFSLDKTSISALFGKGLYLTNNIRVANDYMLKGKEADPESDTLYITRGRGLTKQGAIDEYIKEQAYKLYAEDTIRMYNQPDALKMDPEERRRSLDRRLRDFQHHYVYDSITSKKHQAEQQWKDLAPTVEVRKQLDGKIVIRKKQHSGALTKFFIPNAILHKCLDAEAEVDHGLLTAFADLLEELFGEEVHAKYLKHLEHLETLHSPWSFRQEWKYINTTLLPKKDREPFRLKFLSDMRENGYTGIKYAGGITLKGGINHVAYVLWDDKLVNSFKVK